MSGTDLSKSFFVIEGADCSGKDTVALNVANALHDKGVDGWLTCEPSEGDLGRAIRDRFEGRLPTLPPFELQRLFVYDRHEHVQEIIERLKKGEVIICNRFTLSTLVYGVVTTGRPVNDFVQLHRDVFGSFFLAPRRTILLEVSVEEARRRLETRGATADRFEQDLAPAIEAYPKIARLGYDWLLGQVTFVDANQSVDEVTADVLNIIWNELRRE